MNAETYIGTEIISNLSPFFQRTYFFFFFFFFSGETPLHQAALKGNVISGAFLVAAGSDLHFITRQGDTPLHYALMSGQEKMVS